MDALRDLPTLMPTPKFFFNFHISNHFINHNSPLYASFSLKNAWFGNGATYKWGPLAKALSNFTKTLNFITPEEYDRRARATRIQNYKNSYNKNIGKMYLEWMKANFSHLMLNRHESVPESGILVSDVWKNVAVPGEPPEPVKPMGPYGYYIDYMVYGFHLQDGQLIRDLYPFMTRRMEDDTVLGADELISGTNPYDVKFKEFLGDCTHKILDWIVHEMDIGEVADILIKVKDAYKNYIYWPGCVPDEVTEDDLILFNVRKIGEKKYQPKPEWVYFDPLDVEFEPY